MQTFLTSLKACVTFPWVARSCHVPTALHCIRFELPGKVAGTARRPASPQRQTVGCWALCYSLPPRRLGMSTDCGYLYEAGLDPGP